MKIAFYAVLILFIIAIGYQLYRLNGQREVLAGKAEKNAADIERLTREKQGLESDIDYFSDAHNLMKEFRSLFNYKKPGEKLIILIPAATSTPGE